jgi:hypothetical protein
MFTPVDVLSAHPSAFVWIVLSSIPHTFHPFLLSVNKHSLLTPYAKDLCVKAIDWASKYAHQGEDRYFIYSTIERRGRDCNASAHGWDVTIRSQREKEPFQSPSRRANERRPVAALER